MDIFSLAVGFILPHLPFSSFLSSSFLARVAEDSSRWGLRYLAQDENQDAFVVPESIVFCLSLLAWEQRSGVSAPGLAGDAPPGAVISSGLSSLRPVAYLGGRSVVRMQGCWWLCSRWCFSSHSAVSQGPGEGSAAAVLRGGQLSQRAAEVATAQRCGGSQHLCAAPVLLENSSAKNYFPSALVSPNGLN